MLKVKYFDDDKFVHSTTRDHLKAKVVSSVNAKHVLVLAPHPDDATFGCAGLLKHLSKEGAHIRVLYIFNGASGNREGVVDSSLVVEREKEAFKASKIIDVKEVNFLRMKEGTKGKKLDENILEELKTHPLELVLVPSGIEWHHDHQNVYEAFKKAFIRCKFRRPEGRNPDRVASGKKPEVWEYHVWGIGNPNIIFPIDKYVRYKNEAIKVFKTQLKVKKYDDAIMAMDEYVGKGLGVSKYAEGYSKFN